MSERARSVAKVLLVTAVFLVVLPAALYLLAMQQPARVGKLPAWAEESDRLRQATVDRVAKRARPTVAPAERSVLMELQRMELGREDRARLRTGPFPADMLQPERPNYVNVVLGDAGELPVAGRFVQRDTVIASFARMAAAFPEDKYIRREPTNTEDRWASSARMISMNGPPPPKPKETGLLAYLDVAEKHFLTEETNGASPGDCLPWLVARAYGEGDRERAETLLVRWVEWQAARHATNSERYRQWPGFNRLLNFLADAHAQGLLREEALAALVPALEATVLSPDEAEGHRRREILQWTQMSMETSERTALSLVFRPARNRNLETVAAALIERQWDDRAQMQLGLIERLSGGTERLGSEATQLLTDSPHPRVLELVPTMTGFREETNMPAWEALFEIACLRFHLREGRWPASAAELAPELLPADFAADSRTAWFVIELQGIQVPVLARPLDESSRLALDFLQMKGRHAASPEELAAWAGKHHRPATPPPFRALPGGPMFLSLRVLHTAFTRPDGSYVAAFENPSPADEETLRAIATKPPEYAHGRYYFRHASNRWSDALAVLKKSSQAIQPAGS